MISVHITKHLESSEGPMEAKFDLEIIAHEFVALFGPSGAGKTTLLRMIAGLETPDSGTIVVDGETWFDHQRRINLPPQKRSIGFVFQDYALFPTMSIRDNLLYAADKDTQHSHIDALLELTELTSIAHRFPSTLSGGQRQRVALARALVRFPKILLLDEPLSALDSSIRHKLQDQLSLLHKREGLTTILVTHDSSEAVKLSTRLCAVKNGAIIRDCPPLEYFCSHSLSGKLQLIGEILSIEEDFPVAIATLSIGNSVVKTVITLKEASSLKIGKQAVIASKAFNPIVIPMD